MTDPQPPEGERELDDFVSNFRATTPVCAGCTFPEVCRGAIECPDCELPICWIEVVPAARIDTLTAARDAALYALIGGDGLPDTTTAQMWLRTTLPPDHPNYVDPAALDPLDSE